MAAGPKGLQDAGVDPRRGGGGARPTVRRTRRRMPSGLVRPLCRAGAAPSGRESARAPFDGSKPGLAPGTGTGGPAATRAGVRTAGALARRATPAPRRRDGRRCGPHTMGSHLALTPAALQPHRSPRIRFHFDHASHTGQPRPRGGTDVCILGTEMRERYCPQRAEGERGGDLPPPEGG